MEWFKTKEPFVKTVQFLPTFFWICTAFIATTVPIRKFYCTVSLTVLQWGFGLLHRQAARGAECIWRLGVPPLPTLPTISFLLHRQAARGAGLSDGWYTLLTAEVTLPTFDGYMPVWPYLFSYCTVRPIGIWCLYGKWQYLSSEIWRLE